MFNLFKCFNYLVYMKELHVYIKIFYQIHSFMQCKSHQQYNCLLAILSPSYAKPIHNVSHELFINLENCDFFFLYQTEQSDIYIKRVHIYVVFYS